jgi:uncharacterized membrane protein
MPQRIDASIDVVAPVEKVYDYWSTLENLPQFMKNIEEVRQTGPDTTHWVVKGPLGWNSQNGDVQTSGQVRFKELSPDSTRVEVQMNYWDTPGGAVGEAASRITSGPKAILEQDLRNFKDIMEGAATPEEVQQRPAAADVHSGAIAFLTSGTGLLVLGGSLVVWLLLRRRRSRSKSRIIFEF